VSEVDGEGNLKLGLSFALLQRRPKFTENQFGEAERTNVVGQ